MGWYSLTVELLRVQKHHGASRAGIEGRGVERSVPALHRHDVPALKAADATAPLPGGPSHLHASVANTARPSESSRLIRPLLDIVFSARAD